ncbi:hypothetical protein EDD86DRAFT_220738 [Gorgonomyces haynaldii]|nr:hypothetical protein EDD86DRAFT_220738 [Gorgonomyces haynaldii]
MGLISRQDQEAMVLLDFDKQQEYFATVRNLLDMRRLREALVASQRSDAFAERVLERSVDMTLEARDFEELFVSLVRLVNVYDLKKESQAEYISLFMLYLLTINTSDGLFGDYRMILNLYTRCCQELQQDQCIQTVMDLLKALARNVDYILLQECAQKLSHKQQQIFTRIQPRLKDRLMSMMIKCFYTYPRSKLSAIVLQDNDAFEQDPVILRKRKT